METTVDHEREVEHDKMGSSMNEYREAVRKLIETEVRNTIDEEMRNDIWESDNQGLLFILQYTRDYIKLYDKEGVQIWIREEL